ncbi:endonuclease/exonuclease/phosphatase family protein [Kribbella sp. NPDC026611]|uniref:endonuclease/exonuclease/phosphatase family protein n=1 Tax=Kribbella sp. NPDC026611 TaxID=3154911 RepID=UPI00340850E2
MRIASFNVENLFARAKALNLNSWAAAKPVLAAQAELNALFEETVYTEPTKAEILKQLGILGLLTADDSEFVRLRKIRGRLLKRPRTGPVEVVANGRADWIGWVELKTEQVDELAMQHTAMVIRDINADILGVVEADSRPLLKMFSEALIAEVGGTPYDEVMLVDGNDDRGIDVGILLRNSNPLADMRSHVFDVDAQGVVFSRDCCEYHVDTPSGKLVILMNHFKSKGYSTPGDPIGAKRRERQATRVAEIYNDLQASGVDRIVVMGDFNDDPASTALVPLLGKTDLRDISTHPNFEFGPRKGTFGSGNEKDKIDYILLSPALFAKATGGAVFRKGVWRGPRTKNPWEIYPTLTADVHAASDHAAIYADLD